MKKRILSAIIIAETVIITVLATIAFMPKEKPKLSEMSWEEKLAFLEDSGVERNTEYIGEERFEEFAVEMIDVLEENPYYQAVAYGIYTYYEICEDVSRAVNKYYGRNIE